MKQKTTLLITALVFHRQTDLRFFGWLTPRRFSASQAIRIAARKGFSTRAALGVFFAACLASSGLCGSLATEYDQISNAIEVNFVATDQHVHQLWSGPDGVWHTEDLTAITGAPPVASGSPLVSDFNSVAVPNTVEVDYVGRDQHIHVLWFNGSWHVSDLNAGIPGAPNAAVGSALASEYDPLSNNVEVNYIGTDQHVHQFWFNGAWNIRDLTLITAAPLAEGGSPLVSEFNQLGAPNTQEVNYIGVDRHVHTFWFNGTWHVSDLNAGTGAPNTAARSSLGSLSNKSLFVDQVYYTGTDQHLHQFYFDGTSWHVQDMTSGTGSPNVAALSAMEGHFNMTADTLEANFVGTDQHIHQFWSRGPGPEGVWYPFDLNSATGAPDAAALSSLASVFNPFSGAFETDYIATDQHVHQFWFNGTWKSLDLTAATGAPKAAPENSF